MKKVDYASVKELELKAPGASVSDAASLLYKLKRGEIFGTFSLDYRMKLWVRLQGTEGLIPTLCTYFDDFNYLQSCAECMKKLVSISFKGTLFTAMEQSFTGRNQKGNSWTIQESESDFKVIPGNSLDRVDMHYRQIFLYIMRHLRRLSPESILIEPKKADKRPRLTKNPDRATFGKLAILADRLGFETPKITALISSSSVSVESGSKKLEPSMVVDGSGEVGKRRAGRPFDSAYEQSKDYLFIDNMHGVNKSQGSSISPFFVRKSVYLAFFGRSTPGSGHSLEITVGPPVRLRNEPRIHRGKERKEYERNATARENEEDRLNQSARQSQDQQIIVHNHAEASEHNITTLLDE